MPVRSKKEKPLTESKEGLKSPKRGIELGCLLFRSLFFENFRSTEKLRGNTSEV